MAQYIGFSTLFANKPKTTNQPVQPNFGTTGTNKPLVYGKKFRLTDDKLVIQDFVNALNINLGTKVGQPSYGTTIWSFIFEQNSATLQFQIENEIRRVAAQDPRLVVNTIKAYPRDNGVLVEIQAAVAPFNQPITTNIFFNQVNNRAAMA